MDLTADPCENFHQYVCGNWEKFHPLPESSGRQSYFNIINNHVIDAIHAAVPKSTEKSKSHAVSYLSDMFNECLNVDEREKRGTQPAVDLINSIVGGWPVLGKNTEKTTMNWQQIYTNVVTKAGISPALRFTVQYNRQTFKKMLFVSSNFRLF